VKKLFVYFHIKGAKSLDLNKRKSLCLVHGGAAAQSAHIWIRQCPKGQLSGGNVEVVLPHLVLDVTVA